MLKLLSISFSLALFAGTVNGATLAGGTPESTCECYDAGFGFGTYNFTPANSPQTETMQFKCGLKGWRQAFDEGLAEGFKDYLIRQGDYSQGFGNGLCPYSDY